MIDVKNIQIGDWIESPDNVPVKVTYVSDETIAGNRNNNIAFRMHTYARVYNQIPLSDEIMRSIFTADEFEDNYVENIHSGYTLNFEDRKLWVGKWWNGETREAKRKGNDIAKDWWEVVCYENLPGKFEAGVKVHYVHELQHALELMGIDKDFVVVKYKEEEQEQGTEEV